MVAAKAAIRNTATSTTTIGTTVEAALLLPEIK